MTPRDQDALNRRLQQDAANARAAQNARNEQARRAQDDANRKASEQARRNFNEGQERIRKDNQARATKEQKERDRHDDHMRKLRDQQAQQQRSSGPFYPQPRSAPSVDYPPPYTRAPSGRTSGKKGGWFGKAVLFIIAAIFVIGYFGSHSDKSPSDSPAPEAVAPSPPPAQPVNPRVEPPAQLSPSQPVSPAPTDSAPALPLTATPTAPVTAPPAQPQVPPAQVAPPVTAPTLQLISKVQPAYPPLAKQARIGGMVTVILEIGPDGSVVDARAERGSPILVKAATDAALQWRYAPYTNAPGQPLLTTTVNFNFNLNQ